MISPPSGSRILLKSQAMLLLAGRDILALADGRFLVVWVVAGDRSEPSAGIHYNISVGKCSRSLCVSSA